MNVKYGTEEATKQILKEGDKLFRVHIDGSIDEVIVANVEVDSYWCRYKDDHGNKFFNSNINKTYFYTLKEAEDVVKTKRNIAEKRSLLKKYERELNEKLNIKNNFLVK